MLLLELEDWALELVVHKIFKLSKLNVKFLFFLNFFIGLIGDFTSRFIEKVEGAGDLPMNTFNNFPIIISSNSLVSEVNGTIIGILQNYSIFICCLFL